MPNIHEISGKVLRENGSAALCTVVRSEGSTPRHVGSKMLVLADGSAIGTVGGGDLEHRVLVEARMAIADGKPRLLSYSLAEPSRGDPGVCGGQVEVFVEPLLPPATLVIVGAGHVGKAVAHLAKWLGFRVVISDDRAEYCNPQAVPDADEFIVCPMLELADRIRLDARTSLVLTTRGSSVDVAGLPALLGSSAGYIGVIGSKRRWTTTKKELVAKGVPEEQIARVHSPMGLELQAETPEEIAVSILAVILIWRDQGTGAAMSGLARRRATDGEPPEI
ncbi:MAG TPA: XdhC/CoxI family protein [Anaerolineales bacterium]|nr:XdhC/CoxI family protein [Anaerolineales bacterium]